MGYWFKYFLNSDSAQGRKLKPLGGELAAWTMSNQPSGSKQLCMGLSNYQPHLPLCCRSTRNPGCSSTCRSVVRPPSSSCISLHHCASPFVVMHTSVMVAGTAGWEKQRLVSGQWALCGIISCGGLAASLGRSSAARNLAISFPEKNLKWLL